MLSDYDKGYIAALREVDRLLDDDLENARTAIKIIIERN